MSSARAAAAAAALVEFRKLMKIDALLFCVTDILRTMDLDTAAREVEKARGEVALRLEEHQDTAYVQMKPVHRIKRKTKKPARKLAGGARS